jgi:hypothetical protein
MLVISVDCIAEYGSGIYFILLSAQGINLNDPDIGSDAHKVPVLQRIKVFKQPPIIECNELSFV